MWSLDIVVSHPGPQDVIELGAAETNEKIEALAFDRADKRSANAFALLARPLGRQG
jgi:hypothetical protein